MANIIDVIIERHEKVREALNKQDEISLVSDVDDEFRKILVFSISSFFEKQISDAMLDLANTTQSERIVSLIRTKAISRQYHTYFDWDSKNSNKFLGLFGKLFKDTVSSELRDNPGLLRGCEDFLRLGRKRNELAHQNFASANIDWTLAEIITMYRSASEFIDYLSDRILKD